MEFVQGIGSAKILRSAAALALALVACAVPHAAALEQNSECLGCHEASQQFSIGAVDHDSACPACHTPGLLGTHPYHQAGANCGAFCHQSWGESLYSAIPTYLTSAGSFASATSRDTSPAVLHQIHATPRWPQNVSASMSECSSCHLPASCTACHEGGTSARHEDHSATMNTEWTGMVCFGIIGENQTVQSATLQANYCSTAECHDTAGTASNAPLVKEDFSHPAYPEYGYPEANVVVKVGTWGAMRSTAYTGGQQSFSNDAGGSLSVSFTGERVALIGDVDPYRGQAEVWIDGEYGTTIDCYSPVTRRQQRLWTSDTLASSTHTITVKVLGTMNASSRGAWIAVDCFKVHADGSASIAPACDDSACHAGFTTGHGSGSHVIHMSATDPRGPGGMNCTDCHAAGNFPGFVSGTDTDGSGKVELDETTACDTCHSPGGSYNGVESTLAPSGAMSVGAKDNWADEVYETTTTLQAGKEKWCVGCHDNWGAVILGVSAPTVAGSETTPTAYGVGYGFYTTGHGLATDEAYPWTKKAGSPLERKGAGLECTECHDMSIGHIDGLARTYDSHSSAGTPEKYQAGYRLKSVSGAVPLAIPRTGTWGEIVAQDFALCFKSGCHSSTPFITGSSVLTDFRDDSNGTNYHVYHLEVGASWPMFQSDWWGSVGDSRSTCIQCHNVHGSTQLAMVNDGALVDKEPGLSVSYAGETTSPPGLTLPDSVGLDWSHDPGFCANDCHGGWFQTIYRTPFDPTPPLMTYVLGQTGSATLTVAFSEGVYADLGATGELTTSDFALVDVDDGRSIVGITHAAGDPYAFLTLSSPLDSSGDLGVDSLAALPDSIYDRWGNPMGTTPVTILGSDGQAPTLSGRTPANGAVGVPSSEQIEFEVSDSGSGVDFSTLSVQVTGNKGYSKTYTASQTDIVSQSGAPPSYSVVVQPDEVFGSNELISVVVNVDDYSGISLTPPAWTFTSVDSSPPVISGLSPADGATDVPATSTVSFTLSDPDSGVDLTSLSITLTGSKGFFRIYDILDSLAVTATGSSASYVVSVRAGGNFASQEVIAVGVNASDVTGNAMDTSAWAFTASKNPGVESVSWTTKGDFENNAVVGPDFVPGTGDDGNAGGSTTRTAIAVSGTDPGDDATVAIAENVPRPSLGLGPAADHSACVLDTSEVLAWGLNDYGQVGTGGTNPSVLLPSYVMNTSGSGHLTNVKALARGGRYSLALLSSGEVVAWGKNNYGQLGNGLTGDSSLPVYVKDPSGTGNLTGVVDIACGLEHSFAILDTGEVVAWGRNSSGRLGIGSSSSSELTPRYVKNSAGTGNLTGVSDISAMDGTSLALLSSGEVMAWGTNYSGNLGIGAEYGDVSSSYLPVAVRNPSDTGPLQDVKGISSGEQHALAVLTSGEVVAWGEGQYGRLGDGRDDVYNDKTDQLLPAYVKDPSGTGRLTGVSAVRGGWVFSLAIMSSGEVTAWGHGEFGRLGDGGNSPKSLPVYVKNSAGTGNLTDVVDAAPGSAHTICLSSTGDVMAWGIGNNGRLGYGGTSTQRKPIATRNPANTDDLALVFYPTPGVASGFKVDTGAVSNWTRLSWRTAELPVNSLVRFRVRTSSDGSAWGAWSEYFTQTLLDSVGGSTSLASVSDARWLEVELAEESSGTISPILTDFTLDYSSDVMPPSSTVTVPVTGAHVSWLNDLTISGSSSDAGGSGVARVDVSKDSGVSWSPAYRVGDSWDSWMYLWTAPLPLGPCTVMSRAVDAAGNVGASSSPVLVTVE